MSNDDLTRKQKNVLSMVESARIVANKTGVDIEHIIPLFAAEEIIEYLDNIYTAIKDFDSEE